MNIDGTFSYSEPRLCSFGQGKSKPALRVRPVAYLFLACLLPFVCAENLFAQVGEDKPKYISRLIPDSLKGDQPLIQVWQKTGGFGDKGLVVNPLDAIKGRLAGVNVSRGGDQRQASLTSVRVRGTTSLTGGNDPLVVIDGVSSDLATLSTIFPSDILSYQVLKNASETAQYGSRGASGVIIVTTAKGARGKFHISYDGNVGFETAYKNLEMLSGRNYVATAKALGLSVNDGGEDNDNLRAITQTGFIQNHHLAFSGGTEQSNYRASMSVMNHQMVVRTNNYRNFTAKFDLMQKAFDDWLTVNFGLFGSSLSNKKILDTQRLFYSAASQNPTFSTQQNAAGGWDVNTLASQITHPMALLHQKDHDRGFNINTHLSFDFPLAKGLTARLFGSYSFTTLENDIFQPTWTEAQGKMYRRENKSEDLLGSVQLNYNNTWGAHKLQLTGTAEYQNNRKQFFFTTVKGLSSNDFGYDNLTAGSIRPQDGTGSGYESPKLTSFMGSLSYTLLGRYALSLTLRADGSTLVGKNNTWGYFPSAGLEWNVKEEKWLKSVHWLDQFKLRTSVGRSGNLGGIMAYYTLQMLMPNGIVPHYGRPTVTLGQLRNINPDLKWETRTSFNVGMEAGFFSNRIHVYAEYYHSKTTDMLYNYDVSVPPFAYNKLLANIGSMSNSGMEFGLGLDLIRKKDMELSVNMNLSFQQNKLLSLTGMYNGELLSSPDITPIGGLTGAGMHGGHNFITYQIVGQPLGVFYLPHCTGLTQNADGSYSYACADLDNNGRINLEDGGDRRVAGQAVPKATLGSNISFRYRMWDVTMQLNGAFGHKIYNGTSLTYMNMASFPDYNVLQEAPQQNIKDQKATDYWLERGDYLNIDYLTIGCNLPVRSRFVNALRLSLSVNNLATITGYSGLTPIINSYVVNNTLGIDDKRSYPPYRSFSLGLSVQF